MDSKSRDIIDVDVHLTVKPEDLAPYVDKQYRDLVELGRIFSNPSTWDSTMGGRIGMMERYHEFTDREAVREFQEKFDIDYPIVNTFEPLDKFSDPEVSTALMRAYNDYLIENVLDERSGIYGLAGLSLQDPAAAAEEIERIGSEDAIVGAYVGNNGVNPLFGSRQYDPIYEALEKHDLPIALHANSDGFVYDFQAQYHGFEKFVECHSVVHMWYQTMAMSNMIFQGLPERFPSLDVVILEAGISWIPYMMFRMNREYSMRKREAPLLTKLPEEYVRDHFYFGTQPMGEPMDVRHLNSIVDIVGIESLLFASDYPHWDFDHPDIVERLDPHEKRKLMHSNAAKVFSIGE